ncbi:partial putative ABC transporter ATP-binding protein YknY, partial [Geobacteraceae bacterium]
MMLDAALRSTAPQAASPAAADVIVRLEGVTRLYQQDGVAVKALDGIDLQIRRGDFAVLVGPSGSGKTTLLNMIGGLDSPTAGRVWVGGTEIGRMSKAELSEVRLRKIGFVFQEFNLIPVLSALENVEFVM